MHYPALETITHVGEKADIANSPEFMGFHQSFKNSISAVSIGYFLGLLMATVLYGTVSNPYLLLGWFISFTLVSLFRLAGVLYFRKREERTGTAIRGFHYSGLIAASIAWGSMLLFVTPQLPETYAYLIYISLGAVMMSATMANFSHMPSYWFSTVPMVALTLVVFAVTHGPSQLVPGLMVVFFFLSSLFARNHNQQYRELIGLRQNNENLLVEVEQKNHSLQREVLQRRQIEDTLRASEAQLNDLLKNAPDPVLVIDSRQKILFANARVEDLFGYSHDLLEGKHISSLFKEETGHFDWVNKAFIAMRNGTSGDVVVEVLGCHRDGYDFPVELTFGGFKQEHEWLLTIAIRDIKSRKHMESLTESIDDLVYRMEENGNIVWCNGAAPSLLGIEKADLLHTPFTRFIHLDDHITAQTALAKAFRNGKSEARLRVMLGGGVAHSHHFRFARIEDAQGVPQGLVSIGRDVTEQYLMEKKLHDNEERFRLSQQFSNVGTWEWNVKTGEVTWSDQVWALLGLEYRSVDPGFDLYMNSIYEDDQSLLLDAVNASVEHGTPIDIEYRVQWQDGSIHWIRGRGNVIRDEEGDADRLLGVLIDIDSAKTSEHEQHSLSKQLQQAQKMETLGHLTGGIAHDFNNLLTSILGYSQLGVEHLQKNKYDKLPEFLEQVVIAGDRGRELVSQMLAFSRMGKGTFSALDLVPLVKESVKMLRPMLPSSIDISTQLRDMPLVMADAGQVNQMLINLCINARDAMNGRGKLSIELNTVFHDQLVCDSCHIAYSGEFVELSVVDNGSGISKNVVDRIFEPFVTTKEVGKGSGMGLAMLHGIIHEHKGHVRLETKVGQGTTFKLMFPVTHEQLKPVDHSEMTKDNVPVNGQGKRIAVVDDEVAITLLYKEVLEDFGYKVTLFNNSQKAWEYVDEHPDEFDLLITDQTMPELTGLELAQAIKIVAPGIPIILCTGFSEAVNDETIKKSGINRMFTKPVNNEMLVHAINELIRKEK